MARDEKTYGFNKDDANALIESIGNSESTFPLGGPGQQQLSRIFQTPSGGIAARSGTTAGSAECDEYYVAGSTITATGSSFTVHNIFGTAIGGEVYITAKLIRGKWIACEFTATAGATIVFEISDTFGPSASVSGSVSGSESGNPDDCDRRVPYIETFVEADVLCRPCGSSRVPLETPGGKVIVHDVLNSFLFGRSEESLIGKRGFATLMQGCALEQSGSASSGSVSASATASGDDSTCRWVITWIDWFRQRQVLRDWYVSGIDIYEEFENITVWDHCLLPNEITEGTICEDPGDGGSGSGSGSGSGA